MGGSTAAWSTIALSLNALVPPQAGAQTVPVAQTGSGPVAPTPGLTPQQAGAPSSHNERLFGEVALGCGITTLPGDGTVSTHLGIAVSLGVGAFATSRVALGIRLAGVGIYHYRPEFDGFVGPQAQVWATKHLFAGVGLGVGSTVDASRTRSNLVLFGQDARVGYAFFGRGINVAIELSHHNLAYGGEYASSDDRSITTVLVELGYRLW